MILPFPSKSTYPITVVGTVEVVGVVPVLPVPVVVPVVPVVDVCGAAEIGFSTNPYSPRRFAAEHPFW